MPLLRSVAAAGVVGIMMSSAMMAPKADLQALAYSNSGKVGEIVPVKFGVRNNGPQIVQAGAVTLDYWAPSGTEFYERDLNGWTCEDITPRKHVQCTSTGQYWPDTGDHEQTVRLVVKSSPVGTGKFQLSYSGDSSSSNNTATYTVRVPAPVPSAKPTPKPGPTVKPSDSPKPTPSLAPSPTVGITPSAAVVITRSLQGSPVAEASQEQAVVPVATDRTGGVVRTVLILGGLGLAMLIGLSAFLGLHRKRGLEA